MSELRVDNIVSQDGSAAPIYSKGLNIGAGVTLTNNGDYVVGGATSIAGSVTSSSTGVVTLAGGVTVAGVTTISNTLNVTGAANVTGALNVTGGGNFNNPSGIITTGTLNVSGSTSFGDITGTIQQLNVGTKLNVGTGVTIESNGQAFYSGIVTATSFVGDGAGLTGLNIPSASDWRDNSLF